MENLAMRNNKKTCSVVNLSLLALQQVFTTTREGKVVLREKRKTRNKVQGTKIKKNVNTESRPRKAHKLQPQILSMGHTVFRLLRGDDVANKWQQQQQVSGLGRLKGRMFWGERVALQCFVLMY